VEHDAMLTRFLAALMRRGGLREMTLTAEEAQTENGGVMVGLLPDNGVRLYLLSQDEVERMTAGRLTSHEIYIQREAEAGRLGEPEEPVQPAAVAPA
jgi:hypothetical protein